MTERIAGVMGMVARELLDDPDISSKSLFARVARRYPDVRHLSVRQFHARYRLQAQRRFARPPHRRGNGSSPTAAPPAADPETSRESDVRSSSPGPADAPSVPSGEATVPDPASQELDPSEVPELLKHISRERSASTPEPASAPAAAQAAGPYRGSVTDEDRAGSEENATTEASSTATSTPTPPSPRKTLRTTFYRFAMDLTTARNDVDLVSVIRRIDRYVDEVVSTLDDART